jgi:hypothetical protein
MNLSDILVHLRKELRQINRSIKALERIEGEALQEYVSLGVGGFSRLPVEPQPEYIHWAL